MLAARPHDTARNSIIARICCEGVCICSRLQKCVADVCFLAATRYASYLFVFFSTNVADAYTHIHYRAASCDVMRCDVM